MRTMRSLLWVGSGNGLSQSGMTEAPQLDITWVPDLEEACLLPKVRFDAILLETLDPVDMLSAFDDLERFAARDSVIACLPDVSCEDDHADHTDLADHADLADPEQALRDAGAAAVLRIDPETPGAGFVTDVEATLDALDEQRRVRRPSLPATTPNPTDPPGPPARADEQGETEPRVISSSPAMREVSDLVDLAASSPSTVLVTGETGVGKEVIARELHQRADRGHHPFVALNCAAFPASLLESELFGHEKGAFTGADRAKTGLFETAGQGTLFLDEIAEMELPIQAKLLRVLQEREVRPVGGNRARPVHCRIIAATNRTLSEEVTNGHFREDLFYRLNVFPIRIPPLRERRSDILPLARYFLALHGPREGKLGCHLSLATSQLLEGYAWPGNVRELENEILRTLMLTPSGELITPRSLSPKLTEILEPIAHGARPNETLREALERVEAWMIRRALANNAGRKTRTAQKLGLTREGLYKKLKRLGIE